MWFARQTPLQFAINQQTGKQCAALRQLQPPADRQTKERKRGIQTDGMVNSCSCCSCKFPSLLLLLHICRRAAVRHKLTSDCRLSGQQRVNFVKYFNSRPSAVPFGIYVPLSIHILSAKATLALCQGVANLFSISQVFNTICAFESILKGD